jgi:hypothetical protein
MVEEDGYLEAVATSSSSVAHNIGIRVLRLDAVRVGGVVMQPEVFIWDGRYHVYMKLLEEKDVFRCFSGPSLRLKVLG